MAGTSTPTGKFFPTHCMLSSHEDTKAWEASYRFLKNLGITPRFRMGDGAREISKAGNEVLIHHTKYNQFDFTFTGFWRHWGQTYVLAPCVPKCHPKTWPTQKNQ